MKILVTVKRIPDPAQKVKLKDNAIDLGAANWQLNQFDEYAVESIVSVDADTDINKDGVHEKNCIDGVNR